MLKCRNILTRILLNSGECQWPRFASGSSALTTVPAVDDLYDPVYNPEGVVNLGTGTNYLMQEEVKDRMSRLRQNLSKTNKPANDGQIEQGFRDSVAAFMNKFFHPAVPVNAVELKLASNLTSCVDLLGAFLGKPGEILLCPAPAYSRLFTGCSSYSGLQVLPVPLLASQGNEQQSFRLTRQMLEDAVRKHTAEGRTVRGIILTNPHNPTGQLFPPDTLLDMFQLCVKLKLNLIVSEVYRLSIFDGAGEKDTGFKSVRELEPMGTSDLVHILWGLTKDLCLIGHHAAVLHSRNQELMRSIRDSNLFDNILLPEQQLLSMYIRDHDWIQNFFIPTNHERMRRAFGRAKEKLESLRVQVYPSKAGFFLFCDFANVLGTPKSQEKSEEFFQLLLQNGVYVVPPWETRCADPSWFRIVFTAEDHIFDEGFSRIKNAVQQWESKGLGRH